MSIWEACAFLFLVALAVILIPVRKVKETRELMNENGGD